MQAEDHSAVPRGSRPTSGDLLRRFRRLAGLTQQELAAQSWYSTDYISKLERGQRPLPAETLDRLALVLNLGAAERADFEQVRDQHGGWSSDAGPLVGREGELAAIARNLAGQGIPALLLAGEPGIGKTRLLDEAVAMAEQIGWSVVRAGCHRRSQDPYTPVAEALAASLERLPPPEQAAALRRAGRLTLLLPELGADHDGAVEKRRQGPAAVQPVRAEPERRLLFRAVADYLESIAGKAGTLLVLDDLHWAGSDALGLLADLVTSASGAPLQLIGAYRDSETPGDVPLSGFIADLARASQVRVLSLKPLSQPDAERLVTQLIPERYESRRALVPEIVRRAGGVPFFLVSYVEELLGEDEEVPRLELPWTVLQVIRQRIAALPETVRDLLVVAAVVDQVVSPQLLVRLTGQPEESVLKALEAAADARLLDEVEPEGFRFRHDLIRAAIEQDVSASRRRLLHRGIAESLESLHTPERAAREAEIAWHFLQGNERARALPWTIRAGDRAAAVFAYGDAGAHYRRAADLAQDLGEARLEGQAREKLGDTLYRSGRFDEALDMLEQAGTIFQRLGEYDRYIWTVALSGEICSFGGRAALGIERVETVVRTLEEGGLLALPSSSMADLYAALSSLNYHRNRWQEAVDAAGIAVSVAEATGNQRALGAAGIWQGLSLGMLDRLSEGRHVFARSAGIGQVLGDPWLLGVADYHQGIAALPAGDFDEGERLIRRSLGSVRQAGLANLATFARAQLSELLVTRGQWAEARIEAERAEAESASLGPRPGASYPLCALGHILLLLGERDAGLQRLRDALAMARQYDYDLGITRAQQILAWQAVREGRPADALNCLSGVLESERIAGRRWFPFVYAWALLDLDDDKRAAEVLAEARQQAVAAGARTDLPGLLLLSAKLAIRQHRWEVATDALEEGLALARSIGLPYDEALLLQDYGRMLAANGKPQQACGWLEQAEAIFQHLGAPDELTKDEQTSNVATPAMPTELLSKG